MLIGRVWVGFIRKPAMFFQAVDWGYGLQINIAWFYVLFWNGLCCDCVQTLRRAT